jgi:hypothetical protein
MIEYEHHHRKETNTLIIERTEAVADAPNYEDPVGPFSSDNSSIPALMRRGVVFMSCHNAIWEQAAALIELGINPDTLSCLACGGIDQFRGWRRSNPRRRRHLLEPQQVGFHYA